MGRDPEALRRAVMSADAATLLGLDIEFVPLYCRLCDRSYCSDHWRSWDVELGCCQVVVETVVDLVQERDCSARIIGDRTGAGKRSAGSCPVAHA